MIAQLPPDKMPPPRPAAIPRFQRLFHLAAAIHIDKADIKRYEEFVDHKIYDLLLRGEENAKASGAHLIESWNLPITKGLQECIDDFKKWDEVIALQPILDRLAKHPPLELGFSEETEARLTGIVGGLGVALARAFKILEPELKNPQSKHWDRATQVFDLLL
jgi:Domain of unknown function (DUF1931)